MNDALYPLHRINDWKIISLLLKVCYGFFHYYHVTRYGFFYYYHVTRYGFFHYYHVTRYGFFHYYHVTRYGFFHYYHVTLSLFRSFQKVSATSCSVISLHNKKSCKKRGISISYTSLILSALIWPRMADLQHRLRDLGVSNSFSNHVFK